MSKRRYGLCIAARERAGCKLSPKNETYLLGLRGGTKEGGGGTHERQNVVRPKPRAACGIRIIYSKRLTNMVSGKPEKG